MNTLRKIWMDCGFMLIALVLCALSIRFWWHDGLPFFLLIFAILFFSWGVMDGEL
jgi:hypothetical protein